MKLGNRFIIAYFVLTYLIQIVFFYTHELGYEIFNKGEFDLASWVYLLIIFLTSYGYISLNIRPFLAFEKLLAYLYKNLWLKLRFFWVGLFFVLSLGFLLNNLGDYRYNEDSLSAQGSFLIYFTILLKYLFYGDLLFYVLKSMLDNDIIKIPSKWFIIAAQIFSSTGTTSAMFAVVFLLIVSFPKRSFMLFKSDLFSAFNLRQMASFLLIGFVFIGVVYLAFGYGKSIKNGQTFSLTESKIESSESDWLIQRFSTTVYGHSYLVEDYEVEKYSRNWSIPWDNFWFRIQVLSGVDFGIEKPQYPTINNLNAIVLNRGVFVGDKTGASPGVFPGFMYLFPPVLAAIISGLLLGYIASLLNFISANILLGSVVLMNALPFTKSFVTVLTVVNPQFVLFMMFIGSCTLLQLRNKRA